MEVHDKINGNWTLIEVLHPNCKFRGTVAVPVACVFPSHTLPFRNLLSLSFFANVGLCHCPDIGLTDCSAAATCSSNA